MFVFRERAGRVEVAFTAARDDDRPLNLALPGTAPAAAVGDPVADLAAVATALGATAVCGMAQVHGARVVDATPDEPGSAGPAAPEADGIASDRTDVALLVRVADCVPVLLADPERGVVGAAHAGRLGVVADVVGATVRRVRELGGHDVHAWIGPHVCGRCYEVPAAMQEEVAAVVPQTRATTSWGTPALDLGAGVVAQLADAGVARVHRVERCTVEDPALWSHRRDGASAGRLGGIVRVVA
ncbi:peptidoglycan editing factor PgeF [Nocardioides zeae]|uniref:Purine nucleoside phosphorylase n=1 Tax=Nocardioides imazamoxiresistens TaxID=3231893 RepID=A0ABU3PU28_9ACTN|nr:peptidoglycan editing factor PgeF [Nocardioides zeae]MDT9592732.1 peptidoglycan editing factor PgeF [Nocardioides zeae]